jgi:4'-phosphopantetheinyl transferase
MRHADPGGLSRIADNLGSHDRQRYATFRSEKRRQEFLLGRWLLRRATAAWPVDAAGFTFDSTPSGAPYVMAPGGYPPVAASLSHAGGWFACALAFNGALGIDIEPIIDRDFESMNDLVFSGSGYPALNRLPVDIRPREFYTRWTRHEARFKTMPTGHPPSPVIMYSCIIHGSLLLSLCLTDAGPEFAFPCVMEWVGDTDFRICEAVSWQEPVLYTPDLCTTTGETSSDCRSEYVYS